jgi:hypothetical protein
VRELFVYGFLLSVFDHFFNAIEKEEKEKRVGGEAQETSENAFFSLCSRAIRFATNHLSFFRSFRPEHLVP